MTKPSSSRFALFVVLAASLAACGGGDSEGGPPSPNASVTPAAPDGWIIDHKSTRLDRVPSEWIRAAKQNLRIAYGHTSHGSQIVTGMEALANVLGSPYDFRSSWGYEPGVFLNDNGIDGANDLGSPNRSAWASATRQLLGRAGCDRNVVMWSWCGQVNGSASEIGSYLDQMAALERDFPRVRFVYMTGHLDGSGASGNVHQRNEQIRAFCRSNGKVLFDFADIESFDPEGNTDFLSRRADDGCNYEGGNWAKQWLSAHSGDELATLARNCGSCAHSEKLNCVLKGRAFWWMAARLSGWNG